MEGVGIKQLVVPMVLVSLEALAESAASASSESSGKEFTIDWKLPDSFEHDDRLRKGAFGKVIKAKYKMR